MRLLLDECVPRRFRNLLTGHDVSTAAEMGWAALRNGELLAVMRQHRFEVLITVDQNVEFQQNLQSSGVAILVLVAKSNRLDDLAPLAPEVLKKLPSTKPGLLERVKLSA